MEPEWLSQGLTALCPPPSSVPGETPTHLTNLSCSPDHLWTPTCVTPPSQPCPHGGIRYAQTQSVYTAFIFPPSSHASLHSLLFISSCPGDIHAGPLTTHVRNTVLPDHLLPLAPSLRKAKPCCLPSKCLSSTLSSSPLLCPQLTFRTSAERRFVTPPAFPLSHAGEGSFVLCQRDPEPLLLAAKARRAAVKTK